MSDKSPEPLRGDARWRAQKAEIAKRNEAAHKRGAAQRAADDEKAAARRRSADRHENDNLPVQPEP